MHGIMHGILLGILDGTMHDGFAALYLGRHHGH